MTVLLFSFQLGCLLFFLHDVFDKDFQYLLNKSGQGARSCLILHLRGNISSFSLLSIMLAVCFSYMTFIVVKYIHSAHFVESLV